MHSFNFPAAPTNTVKNDPLLVRTTAPAVDSDGNQPANDSGDTGRDPNPTGDDGSTAGGTADSPRDIPSHLLRGPVYVPVQNTDGLDSAYVCGRRSLALDQAKMTLKEPATGTSTSTTLG